MEGEGAVCRSWRRHKDPPPLLPPPQGGPTAAARRASSAREGPPAPKTKMCEEHKWKQRKAAKAQIQVEVKASEEASRQAEAKATAEPELKLQHEREAAHQALLKKKITREARRKEKAERDAIAEKILVEHLIKMIGINTRYIDQDRAGFDPDYSELELELKLGTELDFEEGIDLEEFRNSRLNIEEFVTSQRRSKDSDYELDFEEGIDLEEFRNSGLNIEEFVTSQRRSKDSDYGTSGQPIKKKPKVSGPDSDKLKRKSYAQGKQLSTSVLPSA